MLYPAVCNVARGVFIPIFNAGNDSSVVSLYIVLLAKLLFVVAGVIFIHMYVGKRVVLGK
jgi:hypothetical protein